MERVLRAANAKRQKRVAEEQASLRPASRLAEYREYAPVVSSQSLIRVKKHTYSVPSRLIGQTLRVELYEAQLRSTWAEYLFDLPRLRGDRVGGLPARDYAVTTQARGLHQLSTPVALYPGPVYRAALDRLVTGSRSTALESLSISSAEAGSRDFDGSGGNAAGQHLAATGKWRATQLRRSSCRWQRRWSCYRPGPLNLEAYDTLLGQEVCRG